MDHDRPGDAASVLSVDPAGSTADAVLATIAARRSVRGYHDRPVPPEIVARLLGAASRAPSGTNTQPWRVHVVTGEVKRALTAAVMADRAAGAAEPRPAYGYYPEDWPEPYLSRRRAIGWDLYGRLGIAKGDRAAARAWHDRNFDFFGASVGLILTTDRRLGLGALIDVGMFAQNVMTGATALGLATCPQAAWASYERIVADVLGLPAEDMVLFGMALGFENPDAVQNGLRTPRVPMTDFTTFHHS